MMKIQTVVIFLIFVCNCHAAKILGLFFSYSKSHFHMGEAIFKALAKKGHEITMMSPFPLKEPILNYKDIDMPELKGDPKAMDELLTEFLKNPELLSLKAWREFDEEVKLFVEMVFQNKEFQKLVASGQKFDVIIMDLFYNSAHFVLGHLFDAPIIVCSTAGTNDFVEWVTDSHSPFAYVPSKYLPLTDEMTFRQRLANTLIGLFHEVYNMGVRGHEEIVQKYFPGAPGLDELKKRIALVFSNAHFSYESPRPYVPNIINVGGCHVQEVKELPQDIKEFLDESKEGVVFFSLGSNVKSIYLPKDIKANIISALGKTSLKVLLKWEEEIPNSPKNVKTGEWLPQNDILAHSNVEVFVTHGGLMSTIEAIHHGVPLVGIPIFADQISNVPKAVASGSAVEIDFLTLTEEKLLAALTEITTNKTYRQNAKKLSDLLRNQPIPPIDHAVYWVEHVIKHKGAPHLKTKAHNLYWYQLNLLDVAGFLVLITSSILGIVYMMMKALMGLCRNKKNSIEKSKQA